MRIRKTLLSLFIVGMSFNILLSQPIYWNQFEYQKYPWIDSNVNVIQTHRKKLIAPFMAKLKKTNKQRVHILHIGDSHVQADIFTHETRTLMGGTF